MHPPSDRASPERQPPSFDLVLDALESVKALPTSSPLWRRLSSLGRRLDPGKCQALADRIAALRFGRPEAEWLRFSALAYLTRDPAWFARQAELAEQIGTPDAVMTMLTLAWHHALVRTPQRDEFMQQLRDVGVIGVQQQLAAALPHKAPSRRVLPRRPPRVAIYTPQVANKRHGGTTFTLNLISTLARSGMELRAFSAQETTVPASESYFGGEESVNSLPVDAESLKLAVTGKSEIVLCNTAFSLRHRFGQMLRTIEAYEPDLVFFVGFMSPLAHELYRRYPTIGLSIHALPPAVPVDVWLSADPAGDAACWPGLPPPRVCSYPFRFWPTGTAAPLDRTSAGLPAAGTVLLTVGFRLHVEIAPPWSTRMLAFLDAHPDVHWLLVGIPEGKRPPTLPSHPRLHTVPPQAKLEPWLATADIYATPPRIGGGSTVAMAMEQGLAVAAFAGTDGGDKLGTGAAASDGDYFGQLQAWVADPAARRQAGQALKALFHARLDMSSDEAQAQLMAACQAATESFDQRTSAAHA